MPRGIPGSGPYGRTPEERAAGTPVQNKYRIKQEQEALKAAEDTPEPAPEPIAGTVPVRKTPRRSRSKGLTKDGRPRMRAERIPVAELNLLKMTVAEAVRLVIAESDMNGEVRSKLEDSLEEIGIPVTVWKQVQVNFTIPEQFADELSIELILQQGLEDQAVRDVHITFPDSE